MEINGWPRHQLRAQGRLRFDPSAGYRKLGNVTPATAAAQVQIRRTDANDSATKSAQLLNFLARTASEAERTLLKQANMPDFALVKNSAAAEFDINDIIARKRKNMVPDVGVHPVAPQLGIKDEASAEGLLGKLADTIADAAMAVEPVPPESENSHCANSEESDLDKDFADLISRANSGQPHRFPIGLDAAVLPEAAQEAELFSLHLPQDGNSFDSISICNSISEVELNQWFGAFTDTTDGDSESEYLQNLSSTDCRNVAALLPAALPPVMPSLDDIFNPVSVDVGSKTSSARHKSPKPRRHRGNLYKRLVIDQPRIAALSGGERLERFDNGAELKKDALGRVRHIRSGLGISIAIAYDSEGQPQSFVRADRDGQMHSVAERDNHGVVVRDLEGRVRAAGESMSVDPSGCLSVRRVDGQFWNLDLVKELHIERRSIMGKDGNWNFLTAVFAADGFRLMTRFQHLLDHDGPAGDRFNWLAAEPTGTFRFYGRDGSVIEFEGEDHLTAMKPHTVWAPGSRAIDSNYRGHHQAGTAWDSVQEYVTSYLSA